MSAFEDTSIFQGVVQFSDDEGREFRAQMDQPPSGYLDIFQRRGGAFVHLGIARTRAKTPRAIHRAIEAQDLV